MAIVTVNETTGIMAYLASISAITDLVGARIFGAELPGSEAAPLSAAVANQTAYGALVITSTPSLNAGPRGNIQVTEAAKLLRCYAETPWKARLIWNECRLALRELKRSTWGGMLLYSAVVSSPVEAREQVTEWPLCFSYFDLLAAEVAAT